MYCVIIIFLLIFCVVDGKIKMENGNMSRSVCQRKIIRELATDHQVEHLDDVLLGIKCVSLVDINIDGFSSAKLYQQRLHVVMKFREI